MSVRVLLPAVVLVVAVACGTATPGASPRVSQLPADASGFAAATCTAIDELWLAWGNPDTAERSPARKSLESAIERHDTTLLDSASGEILSHLAAAREAVARGATWAPGAPANAEFDAVLVGLQTEVTTISQARGDPAVAATAREKMQTNTWPRFLTYLQLLGDLLKANAVPLQGIPCQSAPPASAPAGAPAAS